MAKVNAAIFMTYRPDAAVACMDFFSPAEFYPFVKLQLYFNLCGKCMTWNAPLACGIKHFNFYQSI